ncbi:FAD dependent oxidoreductase [Bremerella volcania]|uniref:FAD dependent oxidoreductase n=1 Tax=Bremerella volcania TaxID=2527984 RepID=A0A518C842_9BACT|nr:FAD-dependent oxidoreductase [Bremerella volcania]QDU75370.1 FAD dependent oxidoreductase [Bremerella volcania]
MRRIALGLAVLFALTTCATSQAETIETDVCVYTATPSGILAAIAVKKGGKDVVIVEPSRWVGGMLGAGLKPMQDCPNYNATGGMTKPLLKSLGHGPGIPEDMVIVPAIRRDFQRLLDEHEIKVIHEHRVSTCRTIDAAIQSASFDLAPFDELGCPPVEATTKGNLQVNAKIFIDASYEGDLLAAAGCSYRTGRESAEQFDEQAAGVREPVVKTPIDPYVTPGDPSSGLLNLLQADHGKPVGSADEYTQAYNYRYYTTSDPEHRLPIDAPEGYSAQDYELVGRYVEYLTETIEDQETLRKKLIGICPGWKNSGEWNYQRDSLITMAPLGISQDYASGDAATKARVWKAHQNYLRGLYEFMRTDPRVPEWYRQEVGQLGLDGRYHEETNGWPHQLYIRVSRRLDADDTITAHDVYNRTQADVPVGLAQYGIDTYPSRRIVIEEEGQTLVANEGNMFVGGNKGPTNVPYAVPYAAIVPKQAECTNLLVPVCFSASHLGYASARMEPVFMICGESAGIAAAQAIEEDVAVQQINKPKYLAQLQRAGQKLTWDPAVDTPTGPSSNQLDYAHLLKECDENEDERISQTEWNAGKKGWEFLFLFIDQDKDGQIDEKEYDQFQQYKKQHPDWAERIRKS